MVDLILQLESLLLGLGDDGAGGGGSETEGETRPTVIVNP
jgi:hypothetical protein